MLEARENESWFKWTTARVYHYPLDRTQAMPQAQACAVYLQLTTVFPTKLFSVLLNFMIITGAAEEGEGVFENRRDHGEAFADGFR